jgi:flagellum-specific ATP synthase
VTLGAYEAGADPRLDRAIAAMPELERFLTQAPAERTPLEESRRRLLELGQKLAPGD